MVTFHTKDNSSDWGEQNRRTIMLKQKSGKFSYRYLVFPVNVAAGHSRGPAQGCGSAG